MDELFMRGLLRGGLFPCDFPGRGFGGLTVRRRAVKPAATPGEPAFRPHRGRDIGYAAGREDGRVVQTHDHSEYGSHAHGGNARHDVQPPVSQHE